MDRAIWRLLVICFAWSLGAVLVDVFAARGLEILVPALFAIAAYVLTRDDGYRTPGGGGGGGNVKYWRGRRVDDRPPRRWN
jgi:hypothetical protein